jgi:hypothetical protein
MVHKVIEYVGEILPDGHLSVSEELRHALELVPNAPLQVTVMVLQPDVEQSQEAWEVFRHLGQEATPGCLPDAAAQHDQYLYGKNN